MIQPWPKVRPIAGLSLLTRRWAGRSHGAGERGSLSYTKPGLGRTRTVLFGPAVELAGPVRVVASGQGMALKSGKYPTGGKRREFKHGGYPGAGPVRPRATPVQRPWSSRCGPTFADLAALERLGVGEARRPPQVDTTRSAARVDDGHHPAPGLFGALALPHAIAKTEWLGRVRLMSAAGRADLLTGSTSGPIRARSSSAAFQALSG